MLWTPRKLTNSAIHCHIRRFSLCFTNTKTKNTIIKNKNTSGDFQHRIVLIINSLVVIKPSKHILGGRIVKISRIWFGYHHNSYAKLKRYFFQENLPKTNTSGDF